MIKSWSNRVLLLNLRRKKGFRESEFGSDLHIYGAIRGKISSIMVRY